MTNQPEHRMDLHMAAIPMRCRDAAKRYAEAYAREAVAAATEQCAQICEAQTGDEWLEVPLFKRCADAIRGA